MTILLIAAAAAVSGCKSISSTLLQRNEMNMGWQTIKSDGVPITLKVPTHFRIAIVDVKYAHRPNNDLGWVLLTSDRKPVTTVTVDHDFIVTEKVFTVDPKRPAAGDIDFTLDLAEDQQYLSEITSDITDRTIEETSLAFERIFAAFRPGASGSDAANRGTPENPLAPIESVRAMQVFEIDDPAFEQNVAAFLTEHFGCTGCPLPSGGTGTPVPVTPAPKPPAAQSAAIPFVPASLD